MMGNKLREVRLSTGEHHGWRFDCPGCNCPHVLSGWTFNNDRHKPTFTPSVLVTYNGRDADGKHVTVEWEGETRTLSGGPPSRCHSYITDGYIRFLEDSTHALRGQNVELPDISETYADAEAASARYTLA